MRSLLRKNVFKISHFLIFILYLFMFGISYAENSPQLTKQQWLEDLDYVTKTLIKNHPDIYYRLSKADFELIVANAEQMIKNSQKNEECLTAIRKVVASIYDGHTSLGTNNIPGYRDIFPVRLYEFSDGIFITGISKEYAKYVGAKVIKIGKLPISEAFKKASKLAFGDNEFSKRNQAPQILITCRFAYGLGVIETVNELPLLVESKDGSRNEIVLSAVTPPGAVNILSGMDICADGIPFASAFSGTEKEVPMYLKHLDGNHNYWFVHDKAHRAIYMQFNLVIHQQDEGFDEFYKRMFKYVDNNTATIDKFILDLRFNNGGNGLMVLPFMNEIIKRDNINRLGHLYTLIGRRSFSASVLLVAEMMLHTQVLLVGEPAGAAQNMFSDMVNRGTLPNSGAMLVISSEILNIAWPGNKNYTIPPHYPAPFSSLDFFSGKDPVLEAIYTGKVKAVGMVLQEEGPKAALKFFNEIDLDWGAHTNELSVTPFTYPISAKYNGENIVNNLGYRFIGQKKMDEAKAAFELNVKLFPNSFNAWDSYAEYFLTIGDNPAALKYYKKSLELNPNNDNALAVLKRLKDKK